MQLKKNNRQIWLKIYCEGFDCNNLDLPDFIFRYQQGKINENDREKLLQCLICSSNVVQMRWKATVSIYRNDEHKIGDFLSTCIEKAEETIKWFDFDQMDNTNNNDFLKVFNAHMGLVLRGRRINFVEEQILSISSFIDTAREFEILSENEIGDIQGLSSEQKKAKRLVKILNEEILTDINFYDKVKRKIQENALEIDDFTKNLIIKRNLQNISNKNFKTLNIKLNKRIILEVFKKKRSLQDISNRKLKRLNRILNRNIILEIFKKSIVGLKYPVRGRTDGEESDPGPSQRPPPSRESQELFIVIASLENEAFLNDKPYYFDTVINFLRRLLIKYGERYQIREFVLESMIQGKAKSSCARKQKSRFHERIDLDLKERDIDNNNSIFNICHCSKYDDLLYEDGGPAFIINGIEKALKLGILTLTKYELGLFK